LVIRSLEDNAAVDLLACAGDARDERRRRRA
jgi:hypothetical protein